MNNLEIRNQKIIDAVIKKANRVCPESLALIGVYGSFATGDFHDKSDLDLLILINDDRGWQLGSAFIQDDLHIGHDLYCTTWDSLRNDSLYQHPNISKLMDSKIVYYADEKYLEKLESLRKKVKETLRMPFTKEDYRKAESMLKEAEHFYLSATVAQDITETRVQAGAVIYYIENAIAMLNKKYFHYGTKRVYEELDSMENKPAWLSEMIESILSATSTNQLKSYLSILIQETVRTFKKVEQSICPPKKPVTADSVKGTYEEMFSNWRNKMYAASDNNDRHLAYMSMISLNNMIAEIGADTEIAAYDVLGGYHPQNLEKTAQAVDELLTQYLKEYQKADLSIAHFKDTDSFVAHYLSKDET